MKHRLAYQLLWTMIGLTLVHLSIVHLRPTSYAAGRLRMLTTPDVDPQVADVQAIDSQIVNSIGPNGNALIRLRGFDVSQFSSELWAARAYFRSVYAMYPRRVFLADAQTVINSGKHVAGASFQPDSKWLADHDVRWFIDLIQEPGGPIDLRAGLISDRDSNSK